MKKALGEKYLSVKWHRANRVPLTLTLQIQFSSKTKCGGTHLSKQKYFFYSCGRKFSSSTNCSLSTEFSCHKIQRRDKKSFGSTRKRISIKKNSRLVKKKSNKSKPEQNRVTGPWKRLHVSGVQSSSTFRGILIFHSLSISKWPVCRLDQAWSFLTICNELTSNDCFIGLPDYLF